MRILVLEKDLSASIRRGHPWIYAKAVRWRGARPEAGEVVGVSARGDTIAVGFADPASPIGVRVLARDADTPVDDAWVRGRVLSALAVRSADSALSRTNALRLVHGENDFMPGLVVDLYRDCAVVVFDGAGAAGFWQPRLATVFEAVRDAGVEVEAIYRRPVRGRGDGGLWVKGAPGDGELVIHEDDAQFAVDVVRGQKTGLFLDQRDNRLCLRSWVAGGDVLNLFCYNGGFSVHAGLAGARRVTSVDIAAPAIEAAQANWQRNGLDAGAHEAVAADVKDFLGSAAERGRRWDVVVCDPPSFAPSEKARQRGLRAYRAVNRHAMECVNRGGLLVSASCSSHVRAADLESIVVDVASELGRRARLVAVTGAAGDHPVAVGFPEGRYLDCLWVRLD